VGKPPPPPLHEVEAPEDFAQVAPRDLHRTSDIRFVIIEVTKLATLVERLVTDVAGLDVKVDDLRHKVTFVKGALWVMGIVLTVLTGAALWYMSGKLSVTVNPNAPTAATTLPTRG
jgi:hypothetical protein